MSPLEALIIGAGIQLLVGGVILKRLDRIEDRFMNHLEEHP